VVGLESKETQGDSWRAGASHGGWFARNSPDHHDNRALLSPNVEGDQPGHFLTPAREISLRQSNTSRNRSAGGDWETCMTLNGTWGYSQHDFKWKSAETLVRNTVNIGLQGRQDLSTAGRSRTDGSRSHPGGAFATRRLDEGVWRIHLWHKAEPLRCGFLGENHFQARPDLPSRVRLDQRQSSHGACERRKPGERSG